MIGSLGVTILQDGGGGTGSGISLKMQEHQKDIVLVTVIAGIFDANSLYARCYFAAAAGDPTATPTPERVVTVATNLVLSLLSPTSDRLPQTVTHACFCWDTAAKRDKNRSPKPAAYVDGLQLFKRLVEHGMGFSMAIPNTEADDAVATVVTNCEKSGQFERVFVISGDKDLMQLANDNVGYFCLGSKYVLTQASILERWKVKKPDQIALALAILGDPGDGIPGVKGWGIKKVKKLFEDVPDDADIMTAYEIITGQMPPNVRTVFDDCLDLTLLDRQIPGLPMPKTATIGDQDVFNSLGLGELRNRCLILTGELAHAELAGVDAID